jgi:division protein 1
VKAGARSQNPEDRKQSAKLTAHRSEERGKRKEERGKRKEKRGKRKSESSWLIGHSAQGRR